MTPERIQEQLTHLLRVYPVLSPTLIQALLGTKVRPHVWKPVMEQMIEGGTLVRQIAVSKNAWGQLHNYTCIKLND